MCLDATVWRGATCSTDHHLLCARLRLQQDGYRRRVTMAKVKRFDVEKLGIRHCKESEEEGRSGRDEFQEQVVERAREEWPE